MFFFPTAIEEGANRALEPRVFFMKAERLAQADDFDHARIVANKWRACPALFDWASPAVKN